MNSRLLCLGLVFGSLFFALTLSTVAQGQAQAATPRSDAPPTNEVASATADPGVVPSSLVLRFDASAASLDQPSIRAAIAQELGMQLATDGSEQAATLIVSIVDGQELQLTFRPERETLTRSVPITSTSDVPRLVAHLAGNMVRNEADALLAEMQPTQPAAPTAANAPEQPQIHTLSPLVGEANPFMNQAWVFSVLGGAGLSFTEDDPIYGNLHLQLSKRFHNVELGVGARFGYGKMVTSAVTGGAQSEAIQDVMGYQLTLPVSIDYRIGGDGDEFVEVGVAMGVRFAGVMNQSVSITSGSDAYFYMGLQLTGGIAVADNQAVIVRLGWDMIPFEHEVNAGETTYKLETLPFGTLFGWQIGW